jgi:hypothetical protein
MLVLGWRGLQYSRGADGELKLVSILHLIKCFSAGTFRIVHLHALGGVLFWFPLISNLLANTLIKYGDSNP